jgi:hypothetical protein
MSDQSKSKRRRKEREAAAAVQAEINPAASGASTPEAESLAATEDFGPGQGVLAPVEVHQGAVGSAQGSTVWVHQGAVGAARGDSVKVAQSAIGAALTSDLELRQSVVRSVLARTATVEQSFVRTIVASEVKVDRATGVGILLARRVVGDVKVILDWRGAVAFGAAAGLVMGLVRRGGNGNGRHNGKSRK